ncbi:MAG: hypothetical protein ACK5TK_05890 [Betaproteobacteria bacterium]
MPNASHFQPDRWLVCSPAAFESINRVWAEDAPTDGLHLFRRDHGFIESVSFQALDARLGELMHEGWRTVYLVLDRIDDSNAAHLLQLGRECGPALDLRAFEWRASPLDVVDSLGVPDHDLLEALQRLPPAAQPAVLAKGDAPPWWAGYIAALAAWERDAKGAYGVEFNEMYGAYGAAPIDWEGLVAQATPGSAAAPAVGPVAALAAATGALAAELVVKGIAGIGKVFAREFIPSPLSASDPGRLTAPVTFLSSTEQWSVTRANVIGAVDEHYLIFECHEGSIATYRGRSVRVEIAGIGYELGTVDRHGVAQRKVLGPIDTSAGVKVEISVTAVEGEG